jgi:hypothetical protein
MRERHVAALRHPLSALRRIAQDGADGLFVGEEFAGHCAPHLAGYSSDCEHDDAPGDRASEAWLRQAQPRLALPMC